jgi:DNA-binding Lrp family transcriptional regulator
MDGRKRTLDPVDQRLVAALLVHPRATWGVVAEALGIPESTVARRGQRLLSTSVVHVLGTLDVIASGRGTPVMLRVSCVPGNASHVGRDLALRKDIWVVHLLSGSVDCTAEMVVSSTAHLADLVLDDMARMPGVASTSSYVVIRRFATAHGWDAGLLTPEEVRQLRSTRVDLWSHAELPPPSQAELTEVDEAVLAALQEDGRMRWTDVAARAGVMERTARRRAGELMRRGLLRMRAVIDPAVLGLNVRALLWLRVDPAHLTAVGQALAKHHAVLLLAATAGEFNLVGEIALPSHQALYEFLTTVIGPLPGVRDVDVNLELRTVKRAGEITPDLIDHESGESEHT